MKNAWLDISLSDYEGHMSSGSVMQMQTINSMMKERSADFDVKSLMILGVAGGNGLEHFNRDRYETVYGVDINPNYIDECRKRCAFMGEKLKLFRIDLISQNELLPHSELLIADLLIEYIGLECFKKVVKQVNPQFISCGIQLDTDKGFVSQTPYLHAFDGLDRIHRCIGKSELTECLADIDYKCTFSQDNCLPNGKKLIRSDFEKSR